MTFILFNLLGGIGLFLLGMTVLTDGLRSFAGNNLRLALVRFTGSPFKALFSGALVTALVQSSSATTLSVIGFVSAGLLNFPQALGVVMGASLGTTSTSWIVSVLGLKVSMSYYTLPLIGVGVFIRILAAERWKPLGMAIAGFALIFVGIDTLQQGMSGLSGIINISEISYTGLMGHLLMVLIGIAMTVIMQSSSASVTTTLAALHSQSINFEQAASLVIGCAVGTTVTGALAAIGASTAAKRTALAHVLFNLATGLLALILLPVFLWLLSLLQEYFGLAAGAVSLAAFHTFFIGTGVLLFFPFINRFARWIERILPSVGSNLTAYLDKSLLNLPVVALEATKRALSRTFIELLILILHKQGEAKTNNYKSVYTSVDINQSLFAIQEFFSKIPALNGDEDFLKMRESTLHALDHIQRLEAGLGAKLAIDKLQDNDHVSTMLLICKDSLKIALKHIPTSDNNTVWVSEVHKKSLELRELRLKARPILLKETADGKGRPSDSLEILDLMRWIDGVGYHCWRACNYLALEDRKMQIEEHVLN